MAKIEYMDLSERVYRSIKARILSGNLAPGQKILQEKLAAEIGVSRTPLLKALQLLEHEFLVESIPRRGMFVKQMAPKEIIDAFDCREGLEGVAARLTAEKITPPQLRRMKALFEPFDHTELESDRISHEAYRTADQKFHQMLIDIADNEIIRRAERVGNVLIICYNRGLLRPPKKTLPEHFAIIEAIEQGDGERAEKKLKAHMRRSRDQIMNNFQKKTGKTSRSSV